MKREEKQTNTIKTLIDRLKTNNRLKKTIKMFQIFFHVTKFKIIFNYK